MRERETERRIDRSKIAKKIHRNRQRARNGIQVAFIDSSFYAAKVQYVNLIVPGHARTGF